MRKNPFLISGVLLSLVVIGASGCGSSTSSAATSNASGQTSQSNNQTQRGQMASNPVLRTVMEMRHLQSDNQMALTSDQKTKLKPILQNLINTSSPTQDFLQQQADSMNALLTDEQKNFLKQPRTNQPKNNNSSNSNGDNPNKGSNPNRSGQNSGNKSGHSLQPQDIYQQFLNSLS